MKSIRTVSFAAWGVATLLGATAAQSAPSHANAKAHACASDVDVYKSAKVAMQQDRLREARSSLLACARSVCGGVALKCKAGYDKLGAVMPSIIPIVTDETGTPRADVEVKIDGDLLTSRLDGRGLSVDTGLHELSFSMDGSVFNTQKIMVVEGEHNRILNVTRHGPGARKASPAPVAYEPAAKDSADSPAPGKSAAQSSGSDARPPDKPRDESGHDVASSPAAAGGATRWALPRSPWPYVIGGVGLAAVAAGGLTTYWGNRDNKALENQCAPDCSPSSQDHVKTLYIASDVAFGAGLAALGVTTWLFASSRSAEKAPAPAATAFSATPIPSGAVASVSGRF